MRNTINLLIQLVATLKLITQLCFVFLQSNVSCHVYYEQVVTKRQPQCIWRLNHKLADLEVH